MSPNPLRNIPSVNELLDSPPLKGLVERISDNAVVGKVRTALEEMRNEVQTAASERKMPSISGLAERITERLAEPRSPELRPVINATGVLLHGEFGLPLAEEAVAAIEGVAAVARHYSQGEVAQAACDLLRQLSGAEAALVVNSRAGAIVLTLAALAAGQEVIVSRGQLGEIHDGCGLPELVAAAGARLREVGTTNKTRIHDYAHAVGKETAALMLAHPTDFTVVGASASASAEEMLELAQENRLPLVHELGSGGLIDLSELGIGGQPFALQSIRAGAEIVLAAGDGLLGGPSCGIILGKRSLVERIQRHPLAAALRPASPTLAALAATLRLSREAEKARYAIPLLQLLTTSVENLGNRAERLTPQIAAAGVVAEAEAVAGTTPWPGRPLADWEMHTWCIAVRPEGMDVDRLAHRLRTHKPSVVGRIEDDRILLDLRSVLPAQDTQLASALEAIGDEES